MGVSLLAHYCLRNPVMKLSVFSCAVFSSKLPRPQSWPLCGAPAPRPRDFLQHTTQAPRRKCHLLRRRTPRGAGTTRTVARRRPPRGSPAAARPTAASGTNRTCSTSRISGTSRTSRRCPTTSRTNAGVTAEALATALRRDPAGAVAKAGVARRGETAALVELARGRLCLLYTSPSPRDATLSRMPSSA